MRTGLAAPTIKLFIHELRSRLEGAVDDSQQTCQSYATNFGGVISKQPAAVVRAVCKTDILATLQLCRQEGVPVSVRGRGHCCGAQSLCEGGIVIDNAGSRQELRLLNDDLVEVSTGVTWQRLEQDLHLLDRSIPVLTNELRTTIGGTLSVGGYGESTVAHRGQVDLVQRARLILPDGRALWCSATENPDFFRFGLASLGQIGFIEQVVLRTVPYMKQTYVYLHRFDDLISLIDFAASLADDPLSWVEFFSGQHYDGKFVTTCGLPFRPTPLGNIPAPEAPFAGSLVRSACFDDWQLRSTREKRRNEWSSAHHYLWGDYVVDAAHAHRFASFVEQSVLASPVYPSYAGRILILAMRSPEAKPAFPFEPISPTMTRIALGFGLYFRVPQGDLPGLAQVQNLQRAALEHCLELGGRPYLAGLQLLDETGKQQLYGDSFFTLQRLRQQVDPSGLFNAGVFI